MKNDVMINKFGYYELVNKPDKTELKDYYSEKYYQESLRGYDKTYSEKELTYINNKIQQKYTCIENLHLTQKNQRSFLDIGAGEGWALQYFSDKHWNAVGLDYSNYGCKTHNPNQLKNLIVGEISENIDKLVSENKGYDVIWLDNVLEHVLDPLTLLKSCRELINENGILIIEVPNDFSVVQKHLLNENRIKSPFWIAFPDHISYFNKDGLDSLCTEAKWGCLYTMGDFPIDFNLFNDETNYITNPLSGGNCHQSRLDIENLLHSISVEKTNELYRAFADLGLGRQIISFFKGT